MSRGWLLFFLDLAEKHRHFQLLLAGLCITLKGLKASLHVYKNAEFRPHSNCQEPASVVVSGLTLQPVKRQLDFVLLYYLF